MRSSTILKIIINNTVETFPPEPARIYWQPSTQPQQGLASFLLPVFLVHSVCTGWLVFFSMLGMQMLPLLTPSCCFILAQSHQHALTHDTVKAPSLPTFAPKPAPSRGRQNSGRWGEIRAFLNSCC